MPSMAFLLLALFALAQTGAPIPSEQEEPDNTATVSGVVTRIGTGEPIGRATLFLTPAVDPSNPISLQAALGAQSEPPGATTDSGGNFVIEDIEPGEYRLVVYRNGFVRQEYGQSEGVGTGTPIDLIAGQALEASFEMIPAAIIAGRIYDEFGEPVPNAQVSALQPRINPDGQQRYQSIQNATTNDRGEYRLFWLSPGEYLISATSGGNNSPLSGFVLLGLGGSNSNVTPQSNDQMSAFFPGVLDAALAAPVIVAAGDELAAIDVRLERETTYTVSGRVISPAPTTNFLFVSLQPTNSLGNTGLVRSGSSSADAEGNFVIQNVVPGTYTLRAQSTIVGGKQLQGNLSVAVTNRDVEDLTLMMSAGISIAGSIYVEGAETPAASAALSGLNLSQVRVFLSGGDFLAGGLSQAVDTEGAFLIENVVPGEYQVVANMPSQNLYLKRVLFGAEEIAPDGRITVPASFDGRLDVLLSPNGGRIEGIASNRDDEAMPNALILLMPSEDVGGISGMANPFMKQVSTDANGRFSLGGIAPGAYRLFAWESTESLAFLNPDFLRRFEGRAERVQIQDGDTQNVNLEVIPASESQ